MKTQNLPATIAQTPKKTKSVRFNAITEMYLQAHGWVPGAVEYHNAYSGRSHDLYGFADYVALHPEFNVTGAFQVTSKGNMGARRKKILSQIRAYTWALCGNRIYILGWKKVNGVWIAEKEEIRVIDFSEEFKRDCMKYWGLKKAVARQDLKNYKWKVSL